MVSVIILTKNEEKDLLGCLESLEWCSDIHVVDSVSSDQTEKIARQRVKSFLINPFISFAHQRNWAIDNCATRNEWILFLDADERSTPAFKEAILFAIQSARNEVAGFYCCWKMMIGRKWLKRCDNFPKWQLRLFRKSRVRFVDFGHGQKEGLIDGKLDYVLEPYLHYFISKGWGDWEKRHRTYACKEARERLKKSVDYRNLFSRHSSQRNPLIKILVARIPLWPWLRFVFTFVFNFGFLEGREGLDYCLRLVWYEKQIQFEVNKNKFTI